MTLFSYPEITVERFKTEYGLDISIEFLKCADGRLTALFNRQTGLKFSKDLCLSWAVKEQFIYNIGQVSKLNFKLYVNHHWNDLNILWESVSGLIHHISDVNINCLDIKFSFEFLDIDTYVKQLYPKDKLPFKISDLSYKLEITRLNLNATFKLEISPRFLNEENLIVHDIYAFLNNFNLYSELKGRKEGVIHNSKCTIFKPQIILVEIDMGSTGINFLKKILKFLSALNKFSHVQIK